MITLGVVFFTLGLSVLAMRDWHKALCCLLPLLAVLERPDMPREIFGITGLNPYNIILLAVLVGFMVQRRAGARPELPKPVSWLLPVYALVFLLAFVRMVLDVDEISRFWVERGGRAVGFGDLLRDDLILVAKWVLPGWLLYRGTDSPARARHCLYGIFAACLLLALQVISRMLPSLFGGDDLGDRALRVLDRNIGYHRVDLAAILASASWAFIAFWGGAEKGKQWLPLAGFLICTLGLVLTGGRAGYAAWGICGALVVWLRWPGRIWLMPVLGVLGVLVIPGLSERLFTGFDESTYSNYATRGAGDLDTVDSEGRDLYSITSGRVILWPVVLDNIGRAPLFGHGMRAFQQLKINQQVIDKVGFKYEVGHSHNAYLELILDVGLVQAAFVLALFAWLMKAAGKRFRHSRDPHTVAVAGLTVAMVFGQLIACIGSQSFFPFQGTALMWCSIGLFLRLVADERAAAAAPAAQPETAGPEPVDRQRHSALVPGR